MQKGLLLAVSGPSGCGKGTVLKEVMQQKELYYRVEVMRSEEHTSELQSPLII